MADNVGYTPGTGATVSADEVTYSGDTSLVQLVRPVLTTGSEGSRTVVELGGDATNGLDVDVTRVSGNVTVVQGTAANLKTDANITNSSITVVQSTAANLKTDANITNASVTVAQPTAGNLNATVVGSGDFTVVQPSAAALNATVAGTVTANAGTGNFTVVQSTASNLKTDANITNASITVAQATAANLNATVTGTVTANAGTGSFTVAQATAANLNATVTGSVSVSSLPALVAGSAQIGNVNISNGTNALSIDTAFGDAESGTATHFAVSSRMAGVNSAGTFDLVRATVTVSKAAQYTSAQTGTAIWTPASGKAVVITSLQIQSYGSTDGTAILWFGASGDTTYTRGTDAALFDGEFAPSGTNKPGVFITFPTPQRGTADYVLRLTTTNAQSITVNVWGYEI